jgi:hypothetical protein
MIIREPYKLVAESHNGPESYKIYQKPDSQSLVVYSNRSAKGEVFSALTSTVKEARDAHRAYVAEKQSPYQHPKKVTLN